MVVDDDRLGQDGAVETGDGGRQAVEDEDIVELFAALKGGGEALPTLFADAVVVWEVLVCAALPEYSRSRVAAASPSKHGEW